MPRREDKRTQPMLRSLWSGEGTATWCEGVSEGGAEKGSEEGMQSCPPSLARAVLILCWYLAEHHLGSC